MAYSINSPSSSAKLAERTWRGRLRKVREGKLVGNGTPDYGFRFNEGRDGYEVDQEAMSIVRRILEMVAEEGYTIHGVVDALNREGLSAPGGGRWNRTFVRKLILDDAYRAHSYEEVALLVSPEVAGRLDPEGHYGVFWYNRARRRDKQVSEVKSGSVCTVRGAPPRRNPAKSGSRSRTPASPGLPSTRRVEP